jgi:TetR/AcrR family transcriptional regulator, transcriptional repressor for nem operon
MSDSDTRDRILDAAEARVRRGGYSAFSFRELAEDVGVKSSTVHYYFYTKPELAEALARRYTERAIEQLGDAEGLGAKEAVERVTSLFRSALVRDDRMCLCGVLGAERDALPPPVEAAVAGFFRTILDYLRAGLAEDSSQGTPEAILARLEGALILARSLRDPSVFEMAISGGSA